jgi:aquaporin Z
LFAGGKAFQQLWLFIVAPLLGGIVAALLWRGVFETESK